MPVKPSTIAEALAKKGIKDAPTDLGPLWKGPESPESQGGITQSLLGRFLSCRERFRLLVIEGLKPMDSFNHRLGYGDMWHVCEEALARDKGRWEIELADHGRKLCQTYPHQQELVDHWYRVCKAEFPLYVEYWSKHPDVQARKPIESEKEFKVAYKLPSGRVVYLRGKRDSVDEVEGGIWLQENKTKSDINEVKMQRQLRFDLQTMLYMTALAHSEEIGSMPHTLKGVRYNVIRRPLGGGKGSISRYKATKGAKCSKCKDAFPAKKGCPKCGGIGRIGAQPEETKVEFYKRLSDLIAGATGAEWRCRPGEHFFFKRWNVEVTPSDIIDFRGQCLDPILEQLCHWYDTITAKPNRSLLPSWAVHWRHPFGVYNPMDEGGSSELDEHLDSGSEVGLRRVHNLFPELGG